MIFPERKQIRKFIVREALDLVLNKKIEKPLFFEFGIATGNTRERFKDSVSP